MSGLVERLAYRRLADMFDQIVERLGNVKGALAPRQVLQGGEVFVLPVSEEALDDAYNMVRFLVEEVEEWAAEFGLGAKGLLDE